MGILGKTDWSDEEDEKPTEDGETACAGVMSHPQNIQPTSQTGNEPEVNQSQHNLEPSNICIVYISNISQDDVQVIFVE